jgi:hypothetical protein
MTASRVIAVASTMLAGCLQGGPYACDGSEQCQRPGGVAGECVQGWCAYEDEACDSMMRFSNNAGAGLAGLCVEHGATSGESESADESSSTSSSSTGEDPSGCDEPCTSPPGPCFEPTGTCNVSLGACEYAQLPSGTECDDGDPCSSTSVCGNTGSCIALTVVECDDDPDDCHVGVCDTIGGCLDELLEAGEPCEDGDPCTEADTCDDAGTCQSGEVCPTEDPCQIGTCLGDGVCMYEPAADGTSCGPAPADRCCGGTCVDISSDASNCGGCGIACAEGHACESVANTSDCELAPADTSGRCSCSGATADCDSGHICRTFTPYANRCTPDAAGDCPATYVVVNLCPDYCAYPGP